MMMVILMIFFQHLEDIGIEYDDGDSDEEEEEDEFPQKPQNMPIFDTRQERDRVILGHIWPEFFY